MNSAKQMFWAGIRAEIPLLIGVLPFGLIYGALATGAGLSAGEAQAMSTILFAGSAQFITAEMVAHATPAMVMVLIIAVVNLRHLLYSASIAPYVQNLPTRWKALLAYLLTDEAYATTILYYKQNGATPLGHWFFFGSGLALWSTWQVSTALGIFLGAAIPESWSLDFALPVTFIAMLTPMLKGKPVIAAALSAGITALVAYALPFKLGLILAAVVGIGVGSLLEERA